MYFVKMLLLFSGLILTLGAPLTTQAAVHSENFLYQSYLRAGSGTNLKGGDQECFSNPGALGLGGNEIRLGNECSIYGEIAFTAHHMERSDTGPYFLNQVRLSFSPPGDASFERDPKPIQIVEAFAEGGRLFENLPWGFWVGKRFYRDVDLHLFDWYYFAEANGNGAGINNINPGVGRMEWAIFFQTGDQTGDFGTRQLQWLDLRWFDIPLQENHHLNIWAALGQTQGGERTSTDGSGNPVTTEFEGGAGWLAAFRFRSSFDKGFNDLTIASGNALLRGFSLYAEPNARDSNLDLGEATSLRVVEHLTYEPSPNWAYHIGAAHERRFDGNEEDEIESWTSAGFRPVYFVNDHFQLVSEIGHSVVTQTNAEDRTLTRLTFAPQLSISRSIWGRPVLRAFYSYSFWNEANKGQVGGPSYANETSGQALGFQTEIWF